MSDSRSLDDKGHDTDGARPRRAAPRRDVGPEAESLGVVSDAGSPIGDPFPGGRALQQATILGDPRTLHPTAGRLRTETVARMQRFQGNAQVQRLVQQLELQRRSGGGKLDLRPNPFEEETAGVSAPDLEEMPLRPNPFEGEAVGGGVPGPKEMPLKPNPFEEAPPASGTGGSAEAAGLRPSPFQEEGAAAAGGGRTAESMGLRPNPFEGEQGLPPGGEAATPVGTVEGGGSGRRAIVTELGEEMEVEHLGGAGAAGAAGLRSSPFEEGGGVAPAGATARGQWDSDVLGRVRLAHGALSGDPPDPQLAYNSLREAVASIEAIGGQVQFEENARLYLDLMYVRDLLNNDLIALAPHAGVKAPMERIREAIDPEGALVRQILDSVEPQLTGPAEEGGGSAEAVRAEESGSPAPPSSSLLKPSPFQGPGEAGPRGGPGASSGFLRPSPFEEGGGPTGGAPATDRSRWETEVMSRVRLAHGVLSAAPPDAQLAYNSLIAAVEALAAMHAETEFESNPRLLVDLVRLQNHLNEGATALRPHIGRTPDLARIREALNPEGEMISPYREQVERGLQRTR